jgi:hypothetical protein
MAVQNGVARDDYGNVLGGATITVYDTGTTDLATLYEDSTLAVTTPNPTSADDNGEFVLYIAAGSYDLVVAKPGFVTDTIEEVEISGLEAEAVSHGEAYITATGVTAASTTFATVNATTWADGALENFTRADGVLTYTGNITKHFLVTVVYSITSSAANKVTEFALRVNGSGELAKSLILRKITTGTDVGAAALCSLVELSTGDTLEVVCRVQATTSNLTIEAMNFSIVG